jgi:hypothetical protein
MKQVGNTRNRRFRGTLLAGALGATGLVALAASASAQTFVPPATLYTPPPVPGTYSYTYAPPPYSEATPIYSFAAPLPRCREVTAGVTVLRGNGCAP